MEFCSLFESNQGLGAVIATKLGVCRVILSGGDASNDPSEMNDLRPSPLTEQVAQQLKSYFKGELQIFDNIAVDLSSITKFRARILTLIRIIPYGEIRSYGQVAFMSGVPGAARAIGGAMASNPVPIIVPCHRIVASTGRLTGFSAPGGLTLKKYLLKTEGIEFKGDQACLKIDDYKQANLAWKNI